MLTPIQIYFWGQSKLVNAKRRRKEIPAGAKVFKATKTEETVTGLTPYTKYNMAIKAFNSGGEGPQSDEISFDTLQDGKHCYYINK
jgi:hypothetical protein